MQPPNVIKEKTKEPKVIPDLNEQTVSPVFITGIIIGVILLLLLAHVGFYKTYISHFPAFADYSTPAGRQVHFTWITHFHGMMMMGWLLLLLLQPILILKGKLKWHHRVGSFSYVLAPLVVLALYLINRDKYFTLLADAGQPAALAGMAISIPEAVFFVILYSLAIFYRHRPPLHMRYMVSTAFLFFNPAVGRMFRTYFGFQVGFPYSSTILLSLVGLITVTDSLRTKRISPFVLVFGLLLLHRIIWELRGTPFWQATGSAIAKIF